MDERQAARKEMSIGDRIPAMLPIAIEQTMRVAADHYRAGRLRDAETACRQILADHPDHADSLFLSGVIHGLAGRTELATTLIRQAVAAAPNNADYRRNLGILLQKQGQLDEAIGCFQQTIALRPLDADAHFNLANAWSDKGEADKAIECLERALASRPNFVEAHNNLGQLLHGKGEFDRAISSFQQAVAVNLHYFPAHSNLAMVLAKLRRFDEAIAFAQRALEINPKCGEAYANLGLALQNTGLIEEAMDCHKRAKELRPGNATVHSNLIYAMYLDPRLGPAEIQTALREFNARWEQPNQPHENDRLPRRRLRIGYVSPDFRSHVVGWNLLPLLERHDHEQFEIFCYSDVRQPDEMTDRIRKQADQWRPIGGITDDAAAALVRRDRIDILVDLAIHSADNRLLLFARKPAPIQFTYLGYCGSTGLEAVDYRFSDPYLDPPGTDHLYSEKTIRLPQSYWCYRPGGATPDVTALPERFTFACLNNFAKVSAPAIDLWKQILRSVPGSRLLLHCPPGSRRDSISAEMGELVEFIGWQRWKDYIATFGRASISLDPFPYGGGITSCDSLWMGVPLVTLAGNAPVGRAGESILSQVGLQELVARSQEEYVNIVIELAGNPKRLAEIRRTLRQRMENSPLMDAKRYARDVEQAYRTAWQIYYARP
jgi:protein O-GlcNAc transferase